MPIDKIERKKNILRKGLKKIRKIKTKSRKKEMKSRIKLKEKNSRKG
jgi:hypothetical protein